MVGCWAFGCSNRSEKGYKFHKFPREPQRRAIWVQQVSTSRQDSLHHGQSHSDHTRSATKLKQPSERSVLCEVILICDM